MVCYIVATFTNNWRIATNCV